MHVDVCTVEIHFITVSECLLFMTRTVLPNCGYNHQHVRLAWFSTSNIISALESFVVGPCCLYSRCD